MSKLFLFFVIFATVLTCHASNDRSFYTLNRHNGLSNNCIWQLIQLDDGRIASITPNSVDLFDGQEVTTIPIDTSKYVKIPLYNGATHVYADQNHLLWIKQWQRLYCIDLKKLSQKTVDDWNFDDFYIDGCGGVWYLKNNKLLCKNLDSQLSFGSEDGTLQDVIRVENQIFTFWNTGALTAFDLSGKRAFSLSAYGGDSVSMYKETSLVVKGLNNRLYQVRTGSGGSILSVFDINAHTWSKILSENFIMHTLTITSTGFIYITTSDGYIKINSQTLDEKRFKTLLLPDGTELSDGINTVCSDRQGGIWLGTYSHGLLYSSPLSGIFDTQPLDIEIEPILTKIYMHGRPITTDIAPTYVENIAFEHDDNSPAFQFSTMNYVRPHATFYRYKFSGGDNEWHVLSADSAGNFVSGNGVFYFPLVGLSSGKYTLEVQTSTNPENWQNAKIKSINFLIAHPWWQSWQAYLCYFLIFMAVLYLVLRIYQQRLERKSREEMLLLRIKNLVEQVNRYENSQALVLLNDNDAAEPEASEPEPSPQDKEFMAKATSLVEKHLSDSQYGVEQLAADLCMERTGLYKKLTAMIQQSPVAFIRSIRLHRAATLLESKKLTITDIAERTGFCSASYFSKCFQKEFGCKPSEYDGKIIFQ